MDVIGPPHVPAGKDCDELRRAVGIAELITAQEVLARAGAELRIHAGRIAMPDIDLGPGDRDHGRAVDELRHIDPEPHDVSLLLGAGR